MFGPQSRKQEMILQSDAQILVIGGAAGSGKSYLLQLLPLFIVDDPNTNIVMLRKTRPQIIGGGGIWDTAKDIYNNLPKKFKPRVRERDLEFIFPSGAKSKFQSIQHVKDKLDLQGLQFTLIGVDEACQFEWEILEYAMSRLRSNSAHPSRMVMSCNPDPDHKICELIMWYLDTEGYPIPERDGVLRYFIQRDGEFQWADTEQELFDKFGPKVLPISFSFISATIDDNPIMDENNPSYRAYLEGLNPTDKARLLHGNWFVRPEGANYFQRTWLQNAEKIPIDAAVCRAWDKAGSERTTEYKYPDATVSIKMYKDVHGIYYLVGDYHDSNIDTFLDVKGRFCERVGKRDTLIENQSRHDGTDVTIVFPIDPAAAGKLEFAESSRKLNEAGYTVKSDPTPSNKSKLIKTSPFFSAAENGGIHIVRSSFDDRTYEYIMKELESFDGTRSTTSRKDDFVDAIASAYAYLSKAKIFRVFTMPQVNAPTRLGEFHNS